jgi:excisionase family DNA binding protein
MDKLLKVDQFAELLGVRPCCIRRWILERRISVVKVGRLVRIPLSEFDRVMVEGIRTAFSGKEFGPPPRPKQDSN